MPNNISHNILHDISWVIPLRNDGLTLIYEAFTWLGYPTFITFFLPLLYWVWNRDAATRMMMIVMLSSLLNAFLKDYWMNPRPDIIFRLDAEVAQSFGMPSGHAQVSAVLWFWLAYEVRRLWMWILVSFIMIMICLSRIYLGVHDLEDIIVGLALAALSLLVLKFMLYPPLDRLKPSLQKFRQLHVRWHLLMILMLMLFLSFIWPSSTNSYETLLVCALMMGWLYGRQIYDDYLRYELRPNILGYAISAPILAGLVGIISMAILSIITRYIFAGLDEYSGAFLSLLILSFYMTCGAPLLFKTLRIMRES